jgi:AhpD family alkylhydroperoxidase
MSLRMKYWSTAPEAHKALLSLHEYVRGTTLEPVLVDLVYLRVSQINGCGYCVDLHTSDAMRKGESFRRLNSVVVWREAPFFSERERAAFAWAESLTLVSETGAPDDVYEALKPHFSEKEIADLTYAIALMNALNRIGVGFRRAPAPEPRAW